LLEEMHFREGPPRAALQVSFKLFSEQFAGKCCIEDQTPGHEIFCMTGSSGVVVGEAVAQIAGGAGVGFGGVAFAA